MKAMNSGELTVSPLRFGGDTTTIANAIDRVVTAGAKRACRSAGVSGLALPGTGPRTSGEGQFHRDRRPLTARALDRDPATERLDAILQAHEARATSEVRAAVPVVAHGDA
jgi:hypothetical protein